MAELSRLPVPARTPEGPFGAESATGQRRRWGPRRRVTSRLLVSHVDRVQEASEKDLLEVVAEVAWRLGYAAFLDFESTMRWIESGLNWAVIHSPSIGKPVAREFGERIREGVQAGASAAREELRTGRRQRFPWSMWE